MLYNSHKYGMISFMHVREINEQNSVLSISGSLSWRRPE